jgi:hypothetical protein
MNSYRAALLTIAFDDGLGIGDAAVTGGHRHGLSGIGGSGRVAGVGAISDFNRYPTVDKRPERIPD